MRAAVVIVAILTIVAYEVTFSPFLDVSIYTTSSRQWIVKERPSKFIFYYAHAGFSNQLYALQR